MNRTKIPWATWTWNPWTGCAPEPHSPGCDHCYARRAAEGPRLRGKHGYPEADPFRPTAHPNRLDEPLKRRASGGSAPESVFFSSMGDVALAPWAYLDRIFDVVAAASHLRFLLLTKRPALLLPYYADRRERHLLPPRNLALGVTLDTPEAGAPRLEALAQLPALFRFVSCEPLLGDVVPILRGYLGRGDGSPPVISWVIAGGETGPGMRPTEYAHAAWLASFCAQQKTPFFWKQWGTLLEVAQDEVFGSRWRQVPGELLL